MSPADGDVAVQSAPGAAAGASATVYIRCSAAGLPPAPRQLSQEPKPLRPHDAFKAAVSALLAGLAGVALQSGSSRPARRLASVSIDKTAASGATPSRHDKSLTLSLVYLSDE